MTTNGYITKLTQAQESWCAANGVSFTTNPAYRLSSFVKGGHAINLTSALLTTVEVVRFPTRELDGPDMNDGEFVLVETFSTLKAALSFLARKG
jgi:hypothetical protein